MNSPTADAPLPTEPGHAPPRLIRSLPTNMPLTLAPVAVALVLPLAAASFPPYPVHPVLMFGALALTVIVSLHSVVGEGTTFRVELPYPDVVDGAVV